MLQLIARRLAGSVLILFGVAAITFVLLYLLPADPAVHARRPLGDAADGGEYPPRTRPRPAAGRPVSELS